MCAFKLSTKLQHSCIFLIHQKRKQPYKAVICVWSVATHPLYFASSRVVGTHAARPEVLSHLCSSARQMPIYITLL